MKCLYISSTRSVVVLQFAFLLYHCCYLATATSSSLMVGYYEKTCPSAEAMVRRSVEDAMARDHGLGAGTIRMHFRDCFVRQWLVIFRIATNIWTDVVGHSCKGCGASILLDSTPGNVSKKESTANSRTVRGLEVIDENKASFQSICPSTVSCADILAFAARDAATVAGGIDYAVPSGRRDRRISLNSEVLHNLPFPFFTAGQLKDFFDRKGLALDDMVTLLGVHSFGISHCSPYAFNATIRKILQWTPAFAAFLKTGCPQNAGNLTVGMDPVSPKWLDNRYYKNLQRHRGLFNSDKTLHDSPLTAWLVNANARDARAWKTKFAAAMVHMGSMDVLRGSQGEIRKKCTVTLLLYVLV